MDSLGVFCEGEIDGKPFHIFSVFSQTSSSSDDDLGGDQFPLESLEPHFLCPYSRFKKDDDYEILPYYASPHFPLTKINDDDDNEDDDNDGDGDSDDNDDDDSDDDDGATIQNEICKEPVLPLFWCNNEVGFQCDGCYKREHSTAYYICLRCKRRFHKECVETPLEIQNPSCPFLSFQLYHLLYKTWSCIRCKDEICGMFYHCPTKKLSMHPLCAMKPIPTLIEHPKRHPHTLTFFPKQASLLCDICGLVKEDSFPTYVCTRCIFVVHQDCIYLPFVIKISRHQHRISFTYSLPSGKWSCGVCRQKVDNRFGAYSCNKCSDYFVHSKCALREDVWDGKELEGVPEEPEEIFEPFETIADGIIRHFTHGHHLKLEVSKVYDEYTICQACILPIYEGNYYSCLDGCNFVLHETCASAPRKIHHPFHAHPLMLKANSYEDDFTCRACLRLSCGFVYEVGDYRIDVRCASVSEPFKYEDHDHPLFLALDQTQEREATCRICREKGYMMRKLSCIECNYVLCVRCATLPYKAKYKHDEHFLTFREGKEGSDVFDWCEMCEKKIEYSSKKGFYECDKCCTTLHVHCLIGQYPYILKPGGKTKDHRKQVDIVSNKTQSRPLCCTCGNRCSQKVVFRWDNKTYCSYRCF